MIPDMTLPVVVGAVLGGGAVLLLSLSRKRVTCEKCGTVQPRYRLPVSAAEMAKGGWTCKGCGAELDPDGRVKSR